MLIGITGLKGSGKDTVGDIILELAPFERKSFAGPIKEIAKDLFNWDEEDVNGAFKETIRKATIPHWETQVLAILRKYVHEFKAVNDRDLIKLFTNEVLVNAGEHYPWITILKSWKKNLTISISPRKFMQFFGTNFARQIDNNIWINQALDPLSPNLVITDVRFNNEGEAIKNKGGKIIKVSRELSSNNIDAHSSEKGLRKDLITTTILNDGTKDELKEAVELAMDLIICPKMTV